MSKDLPSSEEIETWVHDHPKSLIEQLPDCIESREAKRVVRVAADLAHQARERRAPRDEEAP